MSIPTLILDGFLGRPARWERLRRRVEAEVGPATIFRYDSTGRTPLPDLAQLLLIEARRIDPTNTGVNLVGYSMGGIVIRSARLIDPTRNIRKAVFMNSPHNGTWIACLIPTPGVQQMRPFDAHMRSLNENKWDVPTLTVWNNFDGVILPGKNTRYDACGGQHVKCAVPIHIWPVWSRKIHTEVVAFLQSPAVVEVTETVEASR